MATLILSYDGRNKAARSVVEMLRNLDFLTLTEKMPKAKVDPTLMSKEEYFAKIERAEQQAARGEGMRLMPGEDLASFLTRNGYAI